MPRGDRRGHSKGSGIRCAANTDGVSLHTFSKDAALRKKWRDFVKLKRKRGLDQGSIQYFLSGLLSI